MTEQAASASYVDVLRNRKLAALVAGDAVSKVGDGMIIVALPLQTLSIHGGSKPALAIALIEAAPYALAVSLSVATGFSTKRVDPRRLMVADCIVRFVALTGVALLAISGHLTVVVLGTTLLLGSALRLMAASNRRMTASRLAGPNGSFAANGLIGTTDGLALFIVGPALGGVLASATSPGLVLLLDGLTFMPLLVIVLVVTPEPIASAPSDEPQRSGWTIMRQTPSAGLLLIVVVAFNVFYMPIEVALPLLVRGPLEGSDATLGYLWAAFGLGALAGALATNFLRRARHSVLLPAVIGAWGVCALGLAVAPSAGLAGVAFAAGGVIYAPFTPVAYSLVQSELRPDEHQPVLTIWVASSAIAAPVGLLIGGPLVELAGIREAIVISAAITLLLFPLARRALTTKDATRSDN